MASGKTRFTPLSTATYDTPWSFLLTLNLLSGNDSLINKKLMV